MFRILISQNRTFIVLYVLHHSGIMLRLLLQWDVLVSQSNVLELSPNFRRTFKLVRSLNWNKYYECDTVYACMLSTISVDDCIHIGIPPTFIIGLMREIIYKVHWSERLIDVNNKNPKMDLSKTENRVELITAQSVISSCYRFIYS